MDLNLDYKTIGIFMNIENEQDKNRKTTSENNIIINGLKGPKSVKSHKNKFINNN